MTDIFKGLYFYLHGFGQGTKKELRKLILSHGGSVCGNLEQRLSYLVTTNNKVLQKTDVVINANKRGIKIVSKKLITESVESMRRLDDEEFLLTNLLNTSDLANASVVGMNTVPFTKKAGRSGKWRTARIFISSTFLDMHGERDHLTRYVFPELQDRCKKLQVHVTPIDLRWGVREEDTDKALEICLSEVENCRPFFIGMIGQRYGWTPFEYRVPDVPELEWVKQYPPGYSVTHLEMESGALRDTSKSRAVFCLRDDEFMQDVPIEFQGSFMSENEDYRRRLEQLKDDIRRKCPSNWIIDNYKCSWRGVVDGKPMVGGLEEFGKHVLETMWNHMKEEFPEDNETIDNTLVDRSYHENFIENHSRHFVGRKGFIQNLIDYVTTDTPKPLLILGEPGSGKTSLVASFVKEVMISHPDCIVIPHFVGAAPGSTNIRNTLTRFCQELARFFNFTDQIPDTYREVKNLFIEFLQRTHSILTLKRKRLLLVFDAVNQFDSVYNPSLLDWLPEAINPTLRIVISTLKGSWLDQLRMRDVLEVTVTALSMEERKEIVRQTLWEYRKKLDERPGSQMDLLLEKKDSYKPLFLVTACEELRVSGVFEQITERIRIMSGDVPGLLEEVLQRLEGDYSVELVRNTLSFLERARGGLLETELLSLLGTDDQPLPSFVWSRLYRSMSSFLRPAGESGDGVLDFFHRQLAKAVRRRYMPDTPEGKAYENYTHKKLGHFFKKRADPFDDGSWKGDDIRGLSEVCYHLLCSESWGELSKILCDLVFIEKKCYFKMTYDLASDFIDVTTSPKLLALKKDATLGPVINRILDFHKFIQGRTYIINRRPEQTFTMALSLPDSSAPAVAAQERFKLGKETRAFIKWRNKPQTVDPCLMTIAGHTMVVRSVVVSRDGKAALSASDDHTLKIWNLSSGLELLNLKGHTASVFCGVISSDSKYIASGSYDRTVRLWDITTGAEIYTYRHHTMQVNDVVFVEQDSAIISVGADGVVCKWSVATGDLIKSKSAEFGAINCVAEFMGTVAIGTALGKVHILNTNLEILNEFADHTKAVLKISINPEGSQIVSASDDRTLKLWDLDNNTCLGTLQGHNDGVCSVAYTPDGQKIVSGSFDNTLIIWDIETQSQIGVMTGHTGSIYSCAFTPDATKVVSCSFDRSIKVWEVALATKKQFGHTARILGCSYSRKGDKVATAARDKTIIIWDVENMSPIRTLTGHASNVFAVDWSSNDADIISCGRDNSVRVWNSLTGVQIKIDRRPESVNDCKYEPFGEDYISVGDDKQLVSHLSENIYQAVSKLTSCNFSKDARRIVVSCEDNTLLLFDWTKRNITSPIAKFKGHKKSVLCCSFSPDGSRIVSGSDDYEVRVWNAKTASSIAVLKKHEAPVNAVAYTYDGKYIVSGSTDCMVVFYDAVTFKEVCAFACRGRVTCLQTSRKSYEVVAGDGSGSMYLLQPTGL